MRVSGRQGYEQRARPVARAARARRVRIALATAIAITVGPSAALAEASTISLAVSADPAEDRPLTVTTSGTADASSRLYVLVRSAGGAPCATTPLADVGGTDINDGTSVAAGGYSSSRLHTPEDPQRYLLCGWITRNGTTEARTSREIAVRPNAASAAFQAPATAVPDEPVVLAIAGATEITRRLLATVKPAGGTGCGSSYATDTGGSDLAYTYVQGAYAEQRSWTFEAGTYLLCAWVQEGAGDLAPEAVASTTISVLPPDRDGDGVPDATDRCPDQPGAGSSIGCPPRVAPAAFSAKAARARDRRRPFRFKVAGRLTPPAGVTRAQACTGQVNVQFKRGSKTISARRRTVSGNCSWKSSVSFASRSRVGRRGRLRVMVRFLGNDLLTPMQAKTFRVRAG